MVTTAHAEITEVFERYLDSVRAAGPQAQDGGTQEPLSSVRAEHPGGSRVRDDVHTISGSEAPNNFSNRNVPGWYCALHYARSCSTGTN